MVHRWRGAGVVVAVVLLLTALAAAWVTPDPAAEAQDPRRPAPALAQPTAPDPASPRPRRPRRERPAPPAQPQPSQPQPTQPQPPDRPSMVVFLVDDMRADDLAWMPATRRLLGAQGTTYTQAVSPHPLCCPARAGLLTGQYAQSHGVQHNTGPRGGYAAFDPSVTVATALQQAGYRTGFLGKYLNEYESVDSLDPGWDVFTPLTSHTYEYVRYELRGEPLTDGYVTHAIQDRTEAALEAFAPGPDPFFLLVDHLAPHGTHIAGVSTLPRPEPRYADAHPGAVPPSLADPAYDAGGAGGLGEGRDPVDGERVRELFLARIRTLASVDDAVRETVAALRRLGELDETVVVFTSDNGFALGEHRLVGKNVLSDEVLRVPLLVRGPGVPAGARDDRVVSLLDLTATVLDLADAAPGLAPDGASLAPGWRGEPAWRDTTLVQTGREPLPGRPASGWAARGVLTGRYLYGADPGDPGSVFLRDRWVDPHELRDYSADPAYADVVAELARRTAVLGDCAGVACHRTFGPLPEPGA